MRRMSTVIDVDLSRYFDTIRHSVLLDKIAGSVNLIWPLLIFSFGSTPSGESTPAPRRSEALRRP